MDREGKSQGAKFPGERQPAASANQADQSVDDFFNQLQSDMRRPDLSQEAIAAAFQAIQKLALDTDTEDAGAVALNPGMGACPSCGVANAPGNKFCVACGFGLQSAPQDSFADPAEPRAAGQHHYHHHYHHFPQANGAAAEYRPTAQASAAREASRARPAAPGAAVSRAETAVRKMSRDWAQACNTRQLDDLVDLYAPDALVLRPNAPAVRGSAAIREFFFAALDSGLGDAEFEPLRVELFGDIAYEAGRCKTLVPVVVGKRREERGKYLILYARQPGGEWKTLVDCWSSDLSLAVSESVPSPAAVPRPRKA